MNKAFLDVRATLQDLHRRHVPLGAAAAPAMARGAGLADERRPGAQPAPAAHPAPIRDDARTARMMPAP